MKQTLSYKEKKRAFNALKSPSMVSCDLELLKKCCPEHPDLPRFMLKPSRCAEDILFCLLEFATEKEIRQNREKMQLDTESRASEAEDRADEAEKRAEEAEERAEDAETRAEVAEERAEAAEQALADEKKKEA